MSFYYSAITGGFYDTSIHSDMFVAENGTMVPNPSGPIADAVAVTSDQYAELMTAQSSGKWITPDANGNPQATDPPALDTDELAAIARTQRDTLLTECDWTQGNDSPLDAATKTLWATYREVLRNVPQQSGFPATVTWPDAP